jgi:hypothetical protein
MLHHRARARPLGKAVGVQVERADPGKGGACLWPLKLQRHQRVGLVGEVDGIAQIGRDALLGIGRGVGEEGEQLIGRAAQEAGGAILLSAEAPGAGISTP